MKAYMPHKKMGLIINVFIMFAVVHVTHTRVGFSDIKTTENKITELKGK